MMQLALIVAITLTGCGTSRCPPGANANSLFCHRIAADVPAEPAMDVSVHDVALKDGSQADVATTDVNDAGDASDTSDANDAQASDVSDGAAVDGHTGDVSDAESDATTDVDEIPDAFDPP